jgi:4-amino-4-deoxy-L-arabinose transferase-like glycosyltransferase
MLIGGALRLAHLNAVPPGLNQDEAVNGYDAYSLVLTGRDHHGHPFPIAGLESFGDWVPPLLTFVTAPAVGVFGLRLETLRAVTALIGVLAIPLIYLLGREVTSRTATGVLAAVLLAVLPVHVHYSRWAIPPAIVPTMVALTLLLVASAMRRQSSRAFVFAALAAALTVLSYPAMKLYVPLLLLCVVLIYAGTASWLKLETLLYAAIIFLAISGPSFYLSLMDPAGRMRYEQTSIFRLPDSGIGLVAKQYAEYFSPRYLFRSGDQDPMLTPPGFGLLPWTLAPLFLAGLTWLLLRLLRAPDARARHGPLLLLAALALYPVPGSLTFPSPHTSRGIQFLPLVAVIAATGIVAIADAATALLRRSDAITKRRAVVVAAVLISLPLGVELWARFDNYFNLYPERVAFEFQAGLGDALAYARAEAAAYDEIWVTDTNQPYIYVLFYERQPPPQVHRELRAQRDPGLFNYVARVGKYRFPAYPPRASTPLPLGTFATLYTVPGPDGRTTYEVRGGTAVDGKRVLIIDRQHRAPS